MKRLLLAILFLLPAAGIAQTTVPGLISYQGRVLDSAGNPVGAGTPVNRTVIFRIWNHPSNTLQANLMYSEQQTVTIADGEFSVLVGQGTATTVEPFQFSESAKAPSETYTIGDAFNGASSYYLGVTVAANAIIASTDNEITPRQQIVSSAFALRALKAETIIDSAVGTGAIAAASVTLEKMADASVDAAKIVDGSIATLDLNDAAVTTEKLAGNAVTSAKIADGSIVAADLANSAVTSAKIADGSIVAADLANGAVTFAKLGSDVGIWKVLGASAYRDTGTVGIGMVATGVPLDATGSQYVDFNGLTTTVYGPSSAIQYSGGATSNVTIRASGSIMAGNFVAKSDQRIKNIEGISDSAADLRTLMHLEITDYRHKNVAEYGNRPEKKLIAQQVREAYPQVVRESVGVIPDVYRSAKIQGGWVTLASDLKVGERVQLVPENGSQGVFQVSEVKDDKFRVDSPPADGGVFVYGREVDDFLSVDYEGIAMLNVSATQELARKVEQQETELSALRAELSELRKENTALSGTVSDLKERDDAREARLAAIEKRLGSPDQPAVRTIPVKTVATAE